MSGKLHVGLSRTTAEANGSSRASVSMVMELDNAIVGQPACLQEGIRQLFDIARQSLEEECHGRSDPARTAADLAIARASERIEESQANGNGPSCPIPLPSRCAACPLRKLCGGRSVLGEKPSTD